MKKKIILSFAEKKGMITNSRHWYLCYFLIHEFFAFFGEKKMKSFENHCLNLGIDELFAFLLVVFFFSLSLF